MVRAGPDVEEDQRPEVDDRQAIAVDRPLGLLRHEVIHHGEEAGGEEEAHRVMAVPPLRQRILDPGKGRIGFRAEDADRQRQIVDEVEHRHRQDERQVEPVRHIDVRFAALDDGADKDRQIGDPDDGQPDVDIPFGLGIFARLGDAHDIAGGGQHDEQLIAPEDEAGDRREGEPRPAGALHDIEAGGDQRIAAKGEDDRRRVQRPQPPEAGIFKPQVEHREGQLQRDGQPDEQADDAPEGRRDDPPADRIIVIARMVDRLRLAAGIAAAHHPDGGEQRRQRKDQHVHGIGGVERLAGDEQRQQHEGKQRARFRDDPLHRFAPCMTASQSRDAPVAARRDIRTNPDQPGG